MREISSGLRFLARGFGFWTRRPKVMLLGAVPAVIASALIGGALIAMAVNLGDLSVWLTGFADDWSTGLRTTFRVLAGIVVVGLALWLSVVVFTALTLVIGDPFYEAISARVEEEAGGVAVAEPGFWTSLKQSIVDSVRLFAKSMLVGILLFAVGLVPVVGPIAALIVGALVGGWFLSVELSAYAFNRRGIRYREYRRLLAGRRTMAVAFGLPVFLLFMIPLGAIIVMPAAVAGATLLAREVHAASTARQPAGMPVA